MSTGLLFPGMIEVFGQLLEPHDLAIIALLVVLEGVLSIDNALVLGILAKRLPKDLQSKALTYGLVGAFVFRFIAIALAAYLLHWWIVKLFGGAYLVYISLKHFFFESKKEAEEKITVDPSHHSPQLVHTKNGSSLRPEEEEASLHERTPVPVPHQNSAKPGQAGFWPTVFVIELTDIAFAVDSILAAIALVGSPPPGHDQQALHPKLWVVVTGGMLGVILMRFAAVLFIRLLEKFPRFELAAYLLVCLIGCKLLADWGFNKPNHPPTLDFHSPHNPAFWVFWLLMILFFCTGFLPQRKEEPST